MHNLRIVCRDSTTASLLEIVTGILGLGAHSDATGCLVYLVVHLTCFVSAVSIEITADYLPSVFVDVCVVVHALIISTHACILLAMRLLIKLIEVIVRRLVTTCYL